MELEADIWAWVHRYMDAAMEEGDEERIGLCRFVLTGLEDTRTKPDRCLAALTQAQQIAEALDEPWWVMFCEHWRLQTLLFRKRDYTMALPLAQAAIAEIEKPAYRDFPQRNCLQEDLISAYQGIDPIGFAAQIQTALARMDLEVSPESGCFHCLQGLKADFLYDLGRLEEARDQALQASKKAALASDYHHVVSATVLLCRIASRQADWALLAKWARSGDMFAGRDTDESAIGELWMWDAVARRHDGDMTTAVRQYRKARREILASRATPPVGFFEAWSAFYEVGGDVRRALRVRGRELTLLRGSGQTYLLCRCYLERCRLRLALGEACTEDATALREVSRQLRDPTPVLVSLDKLTAGVPRQI